MTVPILFLLYFYFPSLCLTSCDSSDRYILAHTVSVLYSHVINAYVILIQNVVLKFYCINLSLSSFTVLLKYFSVFLSLFCNMYSNEKKTFSRNTKYQIVRNKYLYVSHMSLPSYRFYM